jgi:hypothetical protein
MTRRVSVVTEPDDHGYDAYCPELRGCQTQCQTRNNVESQRLRYGFAEQAAEPGRSRERITVVDEDQGRSGALPRRQASPAWWPPSRAASSESS